jgi:hypothetical protein
MFLDAPILVVAEIAQHEERVLKGPVAIPERRPNAVKAKSNDVGEAILVQIDQKSGMLVHLPASGLEAEVGIHDVGILKCAIAVAERHPHAALAEADDVRESARVRTH